MAATKRRAMTIPAMPPFESPRGLEEGDGAGVSSEDVVAAAVVEFKEEPVVVSCCVVECWTVVVAVMCRAVDVDCGTVETVVGASVVEPLLVRG
eukprot:CAMPEP_0175907128 /NCGR_PEP_ID=MMETSP0108-20121206/5902_1 /TAXON_ID=195067 ORGANISM="Goniomonas pacifica, Strain CCMP1869" /NCGR_SAMPLE_ID=MMETSP0108 /ASSEMBLY_ACC=CAM_ASM_000204 /LENGTH=93 /DNA_ID=CAMNT_0017229101 /DNA_START=329 /DNA_END=610 /DNA_ORIENTATION=-